MLRKPPLCQLHQLTETGPGTYSLAQLADMHEAMDMEEEAQRRWDAAMKDK